MLPKKSMKLPASTMDPMLIDPGKFYASFMSAMIENSDLSYDELGPVVVDSLRSLLSACCSDEDLPNNLSKWQNDLDEYARPLLKRKGHG